MLTLALPLLTFWVLMLMGRRLPRRGDWLAILIMAVCALITAAMGIYTWTSGSAYRLNLQWFSMDLLNFRLGIHLDKTSSLMMAVVCTISLLVHLFSLEYMKGERNYHRYFAVLGLFTFAMLGLVLADNLLVIYIFWELVGLCSYLLIGFWYQRKAAVRAARKAFLTNRLGDIGFLIGIMIIWSKFSTFTIEAIDYQKVVNDPLITMAGIGLLMGAMAKSAQVPFSIWLPDAMEGPTPVSALMHAATMVAAGIYLLVRIHFLLNVPVLNTIVVVGAVSAFLAAFAALSQTDIKKVLAYSTISQLGYMMMAIGADAREAALFHLFTHAFFKACLFLCAGAVIHYLHHHQTRGHRFDAQDMRNMGGLRKDLPLVFACYLVAALSLAGVPLFSGFLSKEAILNALYHWATQEGSGWKMAVLLLAFATTLMTAFYIGRQLVLVFGGKARVMDEVMEELDQDHQHIPHQGLSWWMQGPLLLLALLSLWLVFSLHPLHGDEGWFLSQLYPGSWHIPASRLVLLISLATVSTGLLGAWLIYKNYNGYLPETRNRWLYELSFHFLYFDALFYRLYRNRYDQVSPPEKPRRPGLWLRWLYQLSTHFLYLDAIFYELMFTRSFLAISRLLVRLEKTSLNRLSDGLAIATVVLGKILAWADRSVVDGSVRLLSRMAGAVGQLTRMLQGGQIQMYFIWALLGLLLLCAWFFGENLL